MLFVYVNRNAGTAQVNPFLAVTPTQMLTQTLAGKAISQQALDSYAYFDSVKDPDLIPMENRRGVDMNDIWHESKKAKGKISKFKEHFDSIVKGE